MKSRRPLLWVSLFSAAFAFVESVVVVYLRSLYYPEGFHFPLKLIGSQHIAVELVRECATIVMLASVGILAGSTRWQRFSYFMIAFGVWDVFFYVWLKVILNWPTSLFDWDILFLIPLPWIGPVLAPVLISLIMITAGVMIIRTEEQKGIFHVPKTALWLSVAGTIIILYSFMLDTNATLKLQMPEPYRYEMLGVGIALYVLSMFLTFKKRFGTRIARMNE